MWSEVFFTQASSDWQLYEHLRQTSFPECHALHYLQMATEKLGKAYLFAGRTHSKTIRSTHHALTKFLQLASRNDALQQVIGMTARQLRAHVQQLLPLAYEVEHLAPTLAHDGPNPEYPWEAPPGFFHAPATHEFALIKALEEPRGYNLIKPLRIVVNKFEVLHRM